MMLGDDGYAVVETGFAFRLKTLRKELVDMFGRIAAAHGLKPATGDAGIIELYRSTRRDVWVSAYDQLRYLPEIHSIAGHAALQDIARRAGVRAPVLCARPIVRADMPVDPDHEFDQHQDYVFNLGSLNSITIWIPFQDTPAEMGAIKVVPGSHKRGILANTDDGTLADPLPESEYVTVPAKLGQALVFSQLLAHKSGHNTTDRVRFSLQVRFNDLAHAEWAERGWYINEKIGRRKLRPDFEVAA